MPRGKLDPGQVWYDIEEHLVPSLSLSPIDRAIYCYLVRRSRLSHRRRLNIAIPTLARGTQISYSTVSLALRRLIQPLGVIAPIGVVVTIFRARRMD